MRSDNSVKFTCPDNLTSTSLLGDETEWTTATTDDADDDDEDGDTDDDPHQLGETENEDDFGLN